MRTALIGILAKINLAVTLLVLALWLVLDLPVDLKIGEAPTIIQVLIYGSLPISVALLILVTIDATEDED